MDGILTHMQQAPGIIVRNSRFTDLVYADDTTVLHPQAGAAAPLLFSFSEAIVPAVLQVLWAKTVLQNLGAGLSLKNIYVSGNVVESVDNLVYLGSLQTSDGHSRADMRRRISLAAATMTAVLNLERQAPISCNQNPHLPDPRLVSLALCFRNVDLISWQRQVSGGVPYEVSVTDTWHPLDRSHHQPSRL